MTKHKKFTKPEIAALRNKISEIKEVFKNSHLAPPEEEPEEESEPNPNTIDSTGIWTSTGGISTQSDPQYNQVGGYVSDGSNTLFRILTATINSNPISIGSGITTEYNIVATIDIQNNFDVGRGNRYSFYFNGGSRQYSTTVEILTIERNDNILTAHMKVVGALNQT